MHRPLNFTRIYKCSICYNKLTKQLCVYKPNDSICRTPKPILVLEGMWPKSGGIPFVACTTDWNLFFFLCNRTFPKHVLRLSIRVLAVILWLFLLSLLISYMDPGQNQFLLPMKWPTRVWRAWRGRKPIISFHLVRWNLIPHSFPGRVANRLT